jgi:hypothetical protein
MNSADLVTPSVMAKLSMQRARQAAACLACVGVLWIRLDAFGALEFSGGRITGNLFTMADLGSLLFLVALLLQSFVHELQPLILPASGIEERCHPSQTWRRPNTGSDQSAPIAHGRDKHANRKSGIRPKPDVRLQLIGSWFGRERLSYTSTGSFAILTLPLL